MTPYIALTSVGPSVKMRSRSDIQLLLTVAMKDLDS